MQSDTGSFHTPVLLAETLSCLATRPGQVVVDCTLGGGGHSSRIARAISPGGTLIGIDRDREAVEAARRRIESLGLVCGLSLWQSTFANLASVLDNVEPGRTLEVDGVLFDLGVSSHQLDTARGFSFRRSEPLDMRMDARDGDTPGAAELLANASEAELRRVLTEYGEERWAARIAAAIVARRAAGAPVRTTDQLASLVASAVPRAAWPKEISVATRTFQAIRIAVNDELGQLQAGLETAIERLRPEGRIVVISYHSLEDRTVKQIFQKWAGRLPSPPASSPAVFLPRPAGQRRLNILTRRPVVPGAEEVSANPRARSARLRAAQRI